MLGPLLFLIYINDLDSAVTLIDIMSKFADDTKIAKTISNEEDSKLVQTDIDNLMKWS